MNHYYFESLASLYLFLDKTIRILSLISASATFATLVPAFPLLCKVIAAGVSFFTILGNVWGFAKDATTLADLKVAWLDFARKIDSKWDQFYSDSPVSEQDMKKLENDQKGLESSGGRFPTFERLRKLAQDRACDRLKAPRELR